MDQKKEFEIGVIVQLKIGGPAMVISQFTYNTHYKKRLQEGEDASMSEIVRCCYATCLWFNLKNELQKYDILIDLLTNNKEGGI